MAKAKAITISKAEKEKGRGRTAGGGGLINGVDEGPHSHIAIGVEGIGSGGGRQHTTMNKDV